ncbi:MAG: CPBP family intramembrane glutamic endopeptidase [Candidatus Kapaibacterium sp.]
MIKALGMTGSIVISILTALLLYFACYTYLPYLINRLNLAPLLSWHISGSIVFIIMFISVFALLQAEKAGGSRFSIKERLSLKRIDKSDIPFILSALALMYILTGLIFYFIYLFTGEMEINPAFMEFEPIKLSEWYLLATWLFMFFFNIIGEELFWRAYLLPRQVRHFGEMAWIINALCWLIFHLPFGFGMLLLLLPTIIIIPYTVQRKNNTSIGIVLHGVFNGVNYLVITLREIV